MKYRRFGRTNERVSAMGFGTWPLSGDRYGPIQDAEASNAIREAIDAGVNLVDTAPAYGSGHSEDVVGRAITGLRDKILLVTKCGINRRPGQASPGRDSSRENILREVDISLQRLDTDHIDVYLIHWPDPSVSFEEAFGAMDECVKAGKVRFVGVSNFTVEQLKREVAERKGVSMAQLALAWSLHNPVVSTALVGSRTPEELQSNLAGAELELTPEDMSQIDEIMKGAAGMHDVFTPLKQAMEEWGPVAEVQPAT